MFARRAITRLLPLTLIIAAAIAVAGPTAAPACGCGMPIGASLGTEKGLITYRHRVETIVPGLSITRAGPHAAVVFPVPGRPRIRALAAAEIFEQLEAATTPPPPTGAVGAARAPTVVSKQQLGGYQVTVLKGGTGETLFAWLRSNRYALPTGSQAILTHYVGRRWYFVAIRLADQRSGQIKPLAITFRSRLVAYPMLLSRLASDRFNVELFVNATGPASPRGVAGFSTTFKGHVSSLKPAPSAAVKALIPEPYLTRLDATALPPKSITKDLTFRIRSAGHAAKKSSGHPLRYGAAAALVLAVIAAGAYAVMRRRRPPTPGPD